MLGDMFGNTITDEWEAMLRGYKLAISTENPFLVGDHTHTVIV
jgi:hypothetical protein